MKTRIKLLHAFQIGGSALLATLAILYWADLLEARNRFDEIFFALVGTALLLILIPWERIQKVKAGPIELSLEAPAVKDVLSRVNLTEEERRYLESAISQNLPDYETLQGSRILWIDDNPSRIVGERHLFRALGIRISTASSSEMAEEHLVADPDYDLIITDVQRTGQSYKLNQGIPIHEGVNFVVKLHSPEYLGDDESLSKLIQAIPIIFYGAYDTHRLVEFTKPARAASPEVGICNDFFTLFDKVTYRLKEVRGRRTPYWINALGGEKLPTRPR